MSSISDETQVVNQLLNPQDFVNWLESLPTKSLLPSVNYISKCPTAMFLKTFHNLQSVGIEKNIFMFRRTIGDDWGTVYDLPQWVMDFVERGSEYLGSSLSTEDIPVSECLDIMESLGYVPELSEV